MLAVYFKRSSLNASLYIGFAAHIGSRNLKPLAFVLQEISNPSLLCLFFDHGKLKISSITPMFKQFSTSLFLQNFYMSTISCFQAF